MGSVQGEKPNSGLIIGVGGLIPAASLGALTFYCLASRRLGPLDTGTKVPC